MHSFTTVEPSRRRLLAGVTAAAATALAGAVHPAHVARAQDTPDPRVAQIIADTITVDTHNHTRGLAFTHNPGAASGPDVDLAGQMRTAGLSVVCYTYPVDSYRTPNPGDWYRYHLESLADIDRVLASNNMRRSLTLADLEAAHTRREPTIIQNTEGAEWIEGYLERIEESYSRGMRHFQLLHQMDDLVAPLGAAQQVVLRPGSAKPNPANKVSGLTEFGGKVIRECNRLGMVVDMAHADEATVLESLKVAQQPLIVSHTALDNPISRSDKLYAGDPGLVARLVSTNYAKAVADAGGLMGIWRIFPTARDYVTALKQMADVVGVDHTCIGTDTSIVTVSGGYGIPTNAIWPDEKGGFLPTVVGEMLRQGFHADEVAKIIGGNYCRFFGAVTSAHA